MKLSIITIAYNNLAGLRKTSMSVLSQTTTDFEWIIIDGASTDGTQEYLCQVEKQWRGKKENMRIISEPDTGIYNAMNKGICHAHGEYCLFLNSGDYLFSDTVITEVMGQGLVGDVFAGYVVEEKTNRKITYPSKYVTPFGLMQRNVPHQAAFIKRSMLEQFGLYAEDLRILSDYEMMLKAAVEGREFRIVDKQIAMVEPGGISNTQIERMQQEQDIILRRVLPIGVYADYKQLQQELANVSEMQQWWQKTQWLYQWHKRLKRLHK